jgi:hypothetical protein
MSLKTCYQLIILVKSNALRLVNFQVLYDSNSGLSGHEDQRPDGQTDKRYKRF